MREDDSLKEFAVGDARSVPPRPDLLEVPRLFNTSWLTGRCFFRSMSRSFSGRSKLLQIFSNSSSAKLRANTSD